MCGKSKTAAILIVLAMALGEGGVMAGPPGGPRSGTFLIPAGASVTVPVDLVGEGSLVNVTRVSGGFNNLSVLVMGSLTGHLYAQDGPNLAPSAYFTHLPIAKMNIIVRNHGFSPITVRIDVQ